MSESVPHLLGEIDRLRERDAAAQVLIGLLRYHLSHYGVEAAGMDFPPYREWKALDSIPTEVQS